MKQFTKISILTAIIVTPAFIIFSFTGTPLNSDVSEFSTDKNLIVVQQENKMSIFKLWDDDIILSNETVICFNENDPYSEQTIDLLFQNKAQMNLAIQLSYGKNTRKKFTELLDKRIIATFDLVIATKNLDHKLMTESKRTLIENTEEISFLIEKSETNKRLSGMNVAMNDHLKQLNSKRVTYTNPTTEKILESKPVVIATEISDEEIAKSLPKKFEGGAIRSINK